MVPAWLTEEAPSPTPKPCGRRGRRGGFLERTLEATGRFLGDLLGGAAGGEQATGWLARLDGRTKLGGVALLLAGTSLATEARTLAFIHALILALAASTGLPVAHLLRRVWIGVPLITGLLALPAAVSWVTPGEPLWRLGGGLALTRQGLEGCVLLVLRTATSLAAVLLLTWTTRWTEVWRGLRLLGVPPLFVAILAMAHRYLIVLVQLLDQMFLARRARPGAVRGGGREVMRRNRGFAVAAAGILLWRAQDVAEGVYDAMRARGFRDYARLPRGAVPRS